MPPEISRDSTPLISMQVKHLLFSMMSQMSAQQELHKKTVDVGQEPQDQQRKASKIQLQDIDAETKHEEIKRRTPRYKFNITTRSEKNRYKKLALTEAVFVLAVDVTVEYRRLRQEASQLMHMAGPFSAVAMEAHSRFEAFHQKNLIRHLPSVGLEYDEDSGAFVHLE